ncbi:hypothetical protein CEXT_698181 [Caerostris extrusa]|uniref:Uncharacterized protein n=1 Tax=Caerostris extrusa TaxID=172846 RepID=A0AAV4RWF0_CAEEX|nr:hypothetical protein CEXT_698181 [Caerostris extrusa]
MAKDLKTAALCCLKTSKQVTRPGEAISSRCTRFIFGHTVWDISASFIKSLSGLWEEQSFALNNIWVQLLHAVNYGVPFWPCAVSRDCLASSGICFAEALICGMSCKHRRMAVSKSAGVEFPPKRKCDFSAGSLIAKGLLCDGVSGMQSDYTAAIVKGEHVEAIIRRAKKQAKCLGVGTAAANIRVLVGLACTQERRQLFPPGGVAAVWLLSAYLAKPREICECY